MPGINENSTPEEVIKKAKRIWESEDDVEIDENATVSRSDSGGWYVQAWVWVDDTDH